MSHGAIEISNTCLIAWIFDKTKNRNYLQNCIFLSRCQELSNFEFSIIIIIVFYPSCNNPKMWKTKDYWNHKFFQTQSYFSDVKSHNFGNFTLFDIHSLQGNTKILSGFKTWSNPSFRSVNCKKLVDKMVKIWAKIPSPA